MSVAFRLLILYPTRQQRVGLVLLLFRRLIGNATYFFGLLALAADFHQIDIPSYNKVSDQPEEKDHVLTQRITSVPDPTSSTSNFKQRSCISFSLWQTRMHCHGATSRGSTSWRSRRSRSNKKE